MKQTVRLASLAAMTLCGAVGQSTPPAFEVASVKPTPPMPGGGFIVGMNGGPGTADPGRITYVGVPLSRVLIIAYGVKESQFTGPAWLDTERYDLTAKLPEGTTRAQLALMLQALLTERFGLKLHRETKTLSVYALTVGKGGPKLKESVDPVQIPGRLAAYSRTAVNITDSSIRMVSTGQSMSRFADELTRRLGNHVTDMTNLQGSYDFTVEWPIDAAPSDGGAASLENARFAGIFAALQQQAGLKLETRKSPVDFLVIDHIEKVPSEN